MPNSLLTATYKNGDHVTIEIQQEDAEAWNAGRLASISKTQIIEHKPGPHRPRRISRTPKPVPESN